MAAYTTIDDPSAYFKVQLYTGNGSANHAITFDDTDTDMQPDFVWIKNRDANDAHCLFDAARGATKLLSSDANTAEATDADTLDSFASDGFQVDADVKVNTNTEDYVAWNWKANGSGSSNTDGTINTTTTSVNTTSGFSISTYTGNGSSSQTIGHGLGVVPQLIIHKNRDQNDSWLVRTTVIDASIDYGYLDTGDAFGNASGGYEIAWNTSTFSIGSDGSTNTNTETYLAYCWRSVQGFSKIGIYKGNGNADGPFVYTGFAPAYVLRKSTESTYNWLRQEWKRFDKRNTGEEARNLATDDTGAEPAAGSGFAENEIDFLSNGFKIRASDGTGNKNNDVYIYAAFAEAPFVNSNGVPCTAK